MRTKKGRDRKNDPVTKAKATKVKAKALAEKATKSEDMLFDQDIQLAREGSIGDQSLYSSQLESSLEAAIGTALVTFTVTDFKGILPDDGNWSIFNSSGNRLVKHSIALVKHDRVKLKGNKFVVGGHGPVTFRFRIEDSKAETVFYPVGITFKLKKTGGDRDVMDPCARRYFSNNTMHIFGSDMYFTYNYKDLEGQTANYQCYVVIQRDSDGSMGIIDPGIGHDNEGEQ